MKYPIVNILLFFIFCLPTTYAQQFSVGLRIDHSADILFVKKNRINNQSYYYGKQNSIVHAPAIRFVATIKNRIEISAGLSYHQRKIEDEPVYWELENDPLGLWHIIPRLGPWVSDLLPTSHLANGFRKYMEIPIALGYHLINKASLQVTAGIEWAPLIHLGHRISYEPVAENRIERVYNRDETRLRENSAHGIFINAKKSISPNLFLLLGWRIKGDNFRYAATRTGVTIGIQYNFVSR